MCKLLARLGAAALVVIVVCLSGRDARAQAVLKPYVTLILDTSGSMVDVGDGNPTGAGPPSCGGTDNKLNHAKCAIRNIANSYGDIVFGFGRFRNIMSGTIGTGSTEFDNCCSHGPAATGDNTDGNPCPDGPTCTTTDEMFEMLEPLVDGAQASVAVWVNDTANTCTAAGTDPEIWNADSSTPLAGALSGVQRYWEGLQSTPATIKTATESGTTATFTTTAANVFSAGEQIVISGVSVAGYNGTFTVSSTTSTTVFKVTGLPGGLGAATGGTASVVIFQGTAAQGFAPIANDPTKNIFLPSGCNPSATCTGSTCCATQCRPYITILLTDGQETCGPDDPNQEGGTTDDVTFPPNAAAAMLKTNVGGDAYRIETKAIGFGVTPPSTSSCTTVGQTGCQIEDIAHAGGAVDVPGQLEGFYAFNEAGVELAISQIIEGSVRTELCNGIDDNCNGIIDEGFPDKGSNCNNGLQGACLVDGTDVCTADGTGTVCNAGAAACNGKGSGAACTVNNAAGSNVAGTCSASGDCVPTPGTEICGNGIDDDCDGVIDNGCPVCVPQPEICDGKDNDCDGKIDEDTSVPCGVNQGVCTTGVETCVCNGSNCGLSACSGKQPCGGVTPCVETCNGLDDDCNGVVDGITQACSNMPPINGNPAGSAGNNPGDPGQGTPCDAEGNLCACHPGTENCPENGSGVFGPCTGEVEPTTEICDGIDNDCDGKIDEGFVSQSCGACGATQCVNGQIECVAGSGSPEICDGIDNDCDGKIDEGNPGGGSACSTATTCNGTVNCVNGSLQCTGGSPIQQESCNCLDDDCDGKIDEGNGNCPSGTFCTDTGSTCECDSPCGASEFPCPQGKICEAVGANMLCVPDLCVGVTCGPDGSGNAQVCQQGNCVNACSVANCTAPDVCVPQTGQCAINNCTSFPNLCTASQLCVAGTCVDNSCAGVTCTGGQYCEGGNCVNSCAGVTCPSPETCVLGTCQTDACGGLCQAPQVCNTATGTCVANPCQFLNCQGGQYCNPNDGMCETDPCDQVTCPTGQVCNAGTCNLPPVTSTDGGPLVKVTAAGGGCAASGGDGGLVFALGAVGAMLASRKRRRGSRAARTGGAS